jgi:serine/threonine protein kinase/Flp pilus assembly protein TadD
MTATPSSQPLSELTARLVDEMARAWEQGRRPGAETMLEPYPELSDRPEVVLELVYEEIRLRQRHGESTATTEILARFPRWRDQMEVLLSCHRLLDLDGSPSAAGREHPPPSPALGLFWRQTLFPEVEDRLGDFNLVAELGSGSLGRVFLATQGALADRPVVLKVTPITAREHLSLARLQHTHIVPLHSVQDDPERNLRILCMPWFGGATLSRLLTLLEPIPVRRRTGRHLVDALDKAQVGVPEAAVVDSASGPSRAARLARGPARQFLAELSWTDALCWIASCLADALHYVHERGLAHLDLKPSNVLLADDGQPMLLDFHLARPPLQAGATPPDWLGGTPAFMSPEQQAAVVAVRLGRPLTHAVDGRSDIYSLGLMLAEALGAGPDRTGGSPTPQALPGVSVGLADIVARCVRPEADGRYPDAASLALDLRCHLANLPLHGVPNRNWVERWRKWRRRRPYRSTLLAMAAAVMLTASAVGLVGLANLRRQVGEARSAQAEGQRALTQARYDEARERFRRGQELIAWLPGCGELKRELSEQQKLAERLALAEDLHQAVQRLRFLYEQDQLSPNRVLRLEERCRRLWDFRTHLLAFASGLPNEERTAQGQVDLLDLAVLWTDLRVLLASKANRPRVQREALRVLHEAEALFGAHAVLAAERQKLEESLGLTEQAARTRRELATLPLRTAWEHYALGRFHLRAGRLDKASRLFDQAVELQPDAFWPHFYRGQCHYRLGHTLEAVGSLTACLALSTERAVCYYNRALAYTAAGRDEQALADYTRALAQDRTLGAAWLNRAVLHFRAKRYTAARADLGQALRHQASPAAVHYNLALVSLAQGDRRAARSSLQDALRYDLTHPEAKNLLRQLDRGR